MAGLKSLIPINPPLPNRIELVKESPRWVVKETVPKLVAPSVNSRTAVIFEPQAASAVKVNGRVTGAFPGFKGPVGLRSAWVADAVHRQQGGNQIGRRLGSDVLQPNIHRDGFIRIDASILNSAYFSDHRRAVNSGSRARVSRWHSAPPAQNPVRVWGCNQRAAGTRASELMFAAMIWMTNVPLKPGGKKTLSTLFR